MATSHQSSTTLRPGVHRQNLEAGEGRRKPLSPSSLGRAASAEARDTHQCARAGAWAGR